MYSMYTYKALPPPPLPEKLQKQPHEKTYFIIIVIRRNRFKNSGEGGNIVTMNENWVTQ